MGCCKALFVITAITFAAVAVLIGFFVPQLPNYIDSLPLKTRITAQAYFIYRRIGFFLVLVYIINNFCIFSENIFQWSLNPRPRGYAPWRKMS